MLRSTDTECAPVLHLLGECRLYVGGEDASPRGRKARALLGFLAVAPDRSATRERLADLLWTDRGAEQARGSLRQALAEIRNGAEGRPLLQAGRDRVALDGGALRTDIDCIELAAGDRDAAGLARCVEGIRGPFLDRLEGLSSAYDDWLYAERPRQHDRVLSLVLDAVDGMMGAEATAELQTIVRSLEHLDPLNEAVARLGMRVDGAGRDTASLHRRYRRLKDGLAREFDCQPSERTQALFAQLTSLPQADEEPGSPASAGPAQAGAEPVPAGTGPPTIIVAPIEADGAPGAGGEMAAICTDDIRAALSRLPHLRVVALDTPDDQELIRLRVGAVGAYLLSGRLRRIGDQLSVTLRIGSVEDQAVLWSEQLRLGSEDLFEAIDRIVERAAGAVIPSIDRDLAAKLAAKPSERSASSVAGAAPLFTEARIRIKRARSLGDLQEAAATLERVLDLSPDHLPSRLLLARMYNTDFLQRMAGHDVRGFRARADRLCREASALEPSNPDVTVHRAWCHLRRREWDRAERDFERALGMLPYDSDMVDGCAFGLCHLGLLDRAEPLFQRAFRLNPFPPADYHADHAVMLALRGDAAAAEEHFDVSGERGLQYLAARLANAARLDEGARPRGLRRAFTRLFREAWQQPRPPAVEDVLRWVDDTLPFKLPHHRALVRDGLASALGDGW